MATTTTTTLTCDFGCDDDNVTTHHFGYEGKSYEIDLCGEHADSFQEWMSEYIDNGRRDGKRKGRPAPVSSKGRSNSQAIREWAQENGYDVGDRGRIPAEVRAAYEAAA